MRDASRIWHTEADLLYITWSNHVPSTSRASRRICDCCLPPIWFVSPNGEWGFRAG